MTSSTPQLQDILVKLKALGTAWLDWFQQLPTYQKIITTVAALTGSLLARYAYCKLHRKLNNYPPGPVGLPLIGYPFKPADKKWHPQTLGYGDQKEQVVMFYFMRRPIVVIANPDTYTNTFRSEVNRNPGMTLDDYPTPFAMEHDPAKWQKRRQLNSGSFTTLMKSDYLDTIISSLLQKQTFPDLDQQCSINKPYFCRTDIRWLGFCFLYGVFFGVEGGIPGKDDADFHRFLALDDEVFMRFVFAQKLDLVLGLLQLDVFSRAAYNWYKPWTPFNLAAAMMDRWGQKAEQSGSGNEDTYFNRMKNNLTSGKMTQKEIVADAAMLMTAGLHITMASIEIGLYHVAKFPQIQERVYQELAAHFEKYGAFSVKRMSELHVFRAFVYESLRYGSPSNISLGRNVTRHGYKVGPYNVPKGAILHGSGYSIHCDPRNFTKPNDFYLEHFLDANGRFVRHDKFMLFGAGKRDCIGQHLAVKELFCILSALLHRYKFAIATGQEKNFVIPSSLSFFQESPLSLDIERRQ
mmetsp:Transcript_41837/g.68872  ORF Transcript_41837/g.68872 Transcript_41837/m.68872 type:complete len:521 (-) Transcript_41837:89-1651(-)